MSRDPPIREGDELDLVVERITEKGDGLVRVQGFVVFVKDVREGERVRVRVTRVLPKCGFAEVIQ